DHMSTEYAQQPEVKQRAAHPQQRALVALRRACGPTELVGTIAPDMAEHKRCGGDIRHRHPEQGIHCRPPDSAFIAARLTSADPSRTAPARPLPRADPVPPARRCGADRRY